MKEFCLEPSNVSGGILLKSKEEGWGRGSQNARRPGDAPKKVRTSQIPYSLFLGLARETPTGTLYVERLSFC